MPSFATLVRAPNPGPMTLDGTNTWVLRTQDALGCVVVDPGPLHEAHLTSIMAAGPVDTILITHHHPDHIEGVEWLVDRLGSCPVRAADPALCRDAAPLADGDRWAQAGLTFEVIATPGHTRDSICLLVDSALVNGALVNSALVNGALVNGAGERAILTGDTILGRGTAVVAWPDGDLGEYLASLDRLSAITRVPVLPGHGPELPDCGVAAAGYRAHREDRLVQVRRALAAGAQTPAEVVTHVYPDLDPVLIPAAQWTVRAALAYLDSP